jgi:hypothetical protein
MVNSPPDQDPQFFERAVAALRRVTAEYEASGRASVAVEPVEPDSVEVDIRPTASGAAPLKVEVIDTGELNVLVGEAGFLIDFEFDAPDENVDKATSIVESIMARGCRLWLAPRPAGEDPAGIFELSLRRRGCTGRRNTRPSSTPGCRAAADPWAKGGSTLA